MARVISPVSYVLGQNSALWLNKATADEAKVNGLQGMGLGLGFTQSSITVTAMGQRIAPKVYTGAEYDEFSVNANFIPGDPSQNILQAAALNNTVLQNVRMYLKDNCNFSAPDQVSAGGGLTTGTSGLNVGSYSDPMIASPSDLYTNTVSFAPNGPFTLFVAHTDIGGGAELTVARTTDTTITTTGTEWDALGFDVGDIVLIDWDGAVTEVPKYAIVKSIVTSVLTLTTAIGDVESIETGIMPAACQVHAATPMSVSTLSTAC